MISSPILHEPSVYDESQEYPWLCQEFAIEHGHRNRESFNTKLVEFEMIFVMDPFP